MQRFLKMNSFTDFFKFYLFFWNNYFKEVFRMAGSLSRGLMLFSVTKNRWKIKKKKVIEAKTVKILKECLWLKNYQQRNVFTSNGDSNEKLSLKLAVPKFRKWSFQFIFTRIISTNIFVYNSLIFTETYLFSKIL